MPELRPADHRLRHFVELLARQGELETVESPIDLVDVAARLDGNPKAVLLRQAGAKKCVTVARFLCRIPEKIRAAGSEEVFEVIQASGRISASSCAKIFRFSARSSVAASIAQSAKRATS